MTVQNTGLRKAGPSQGNGVNSAFPFTFKVFSAADVLVAYLSASGVESTLVLSSDYSVTLNANQNTSPGGTVNMLWVPQTGTSITLSSNIDNTQNLELTNAGGFYPSSINDALDRIVIQVQQLAEQASRTLRFPLSSILSGVTLPVSRANQILAFDASGNPITTIPASGSAADLALNLANAIDMTKGAALIPTVNRVVDSIAALQALPKGGSPRVFVSGYYAQGDGGGGHYYYDPDDTTSADNGGIIIVANDGGRWKLLSTPQINVKQFGAKGDGATNDTYPINLAINYANANNIPLFFPSGIYAVDPGGMQIVSVGVYGPDAYIKARLSSNTWLMAVNYTTRAGIGNDSAAWNFDFGGFLDSSGSSYVGTGLYVMQAYRSKFTIRKAINLQYGVWIDNSWYNGSGNAPIIFENDFYIKTDSCLVALQITTGNTAGLPPIDVNTFDLSSSFNHKTACVRISAGTTNNVSDVHNNTFILQDLECGEPNSSGVYLTGLAHNNQFIIRNQRGINGTGVYGYTDANATNNLWHVAVWVPGNWNFASNQQVKALDAQDAATQPQGRSLYFAPDVVSAVGTNIPCVVGDRIFRSNATKISNDGWVCTAPGTGYAGSTWTPTGNIVRAWVKFNGSTGAIIASMNVDSVTWLAAADYMVNFGIAMADADYVPIGIAGFNGASLRVIVQPANAQPPTTTSCRIQTVSADGVMAASAYVYVAFIGN